MLPLAVVPDAAERRSGIHSFAEHFWLSVQTRRNSFIQRVLHRKIF